MELRRDVHQKIAGGAFADRQPAAGHHSGLDQGAVVGGPAVLRHGHWFSSDEGMHGCVIIFMAVSGASWAWMAGRWRSEHREARGWSRLLGGLEIHSIGG